MTDSNDPLRETAERIGKYTDGSGFRYVVRAAFDAQLRPILRIESGGDIVEIEAAEWSVVKDAADRALEYVGDHPDATD